MRESELYMSPPLNPGNPSPGNPSPAINTGDIPVSIDALLIGTCAATLRRHLASIQTCIGKLDDAQLWVRANENSNALGNLLCHMAGNVRQWMVAGLGGASDVRTRDREFAARGFTETDGNAGGPKTGTDLVALLAGTLEEAITVIESLDTERLSRVYRIQRVYEVSGVEALVHVTEHFAYHAGQVVFATKLITGEDLGFHRHLSGA